MQKKEGKYRDDYSLRTLSYYQREGGIYNDLITILQRIRAQEGGRNILAPNKILNVASEAYDTYMDRCRDAETGNIMDCGWNEMVWEIIGGCVAGPLGGWEGKNLYAALSVLCVLLSRHYEFIEASVPEIADLVKEHDSGLYGQFAELIWSNIEDKDAQFESLKKKLLIAQAIVREKDSEIIDLNNKLSQLQSDFANLKRTWDSVVKHPAPSDFNELLTLDAILTWIRGRQHYTLTDQVFIMLKDLSRGMATDNEYDRICTLENEMIAKHKPQTIVNNNMGIGSNILTGLTQNPMMPMGFNSNQLIQYFLDFLNNGARRESKD